MLAQIILRKLNSLSSLVSVNCSLKKRLFNNFTMSAMSSSTKVGSKALIAAVQMTSTADKERNLQKATSLIERAVNLKAEMIFLPEGFDFIGVDKEETAKLAETMDGHILTSYRKLAKEFNVWLSLGGFHERQTDEQKLTNNHIIIDNLGNIVSLYRKTHLFDVVIPESSVNLRESSAIKAGTEIISPISTPIGRVGLGICYDLRFPEFSLQLRKQGAEILTYPSAFTVPTGMAHWETLLRSRAIETQCYVVAAGQIGKHNAKRSSYGHTMIIDPWGVVISQAGDNETVITAEIDLNVLHSVRRNMPVMEHRRPDLYQSSSGRQVQNGCSFGSKFSIPDEIVGDEEWPFGQVKGKEKFVFLQSELSRASINKKCVVPGHVLVISKRPAKLLTDLSAEEMTDLFLLVQQVERIMTSLHDTTSSTVSIQNGELAGQSIEHVHAHILPRKVGDFQDNEIYDKLQKHDKGDVVWRTEEDMEEEAKKIRQLIRNSYAHLLLNRVNETSTITAAASRSSRVTTL